MSKQAFQICFFFKRIFKLRVAEPPEEIKQLFDQFSENGTMSVDNLLKFMIDYQKEETAKKEDAQEIFNSLKHLNIFQRKGLHFDAFFRYLYGDHNLPIPNKVVTYLFNFFVFLIIFQNDSDCTLFFYL